MHLVNIYFLLRIILSSLLWGSFCKLRHRRLSLQSTNMSEFTFHKTTFNNFIQFNKKRFCDLTAIWPPCRKSFMWCERQQVLSSSKHLLKQEKSIFVENVMKGKFSSLQMEKLKLEIYFLWEEKKLGEKVGVRAVNIEALKALTAFNV